MSYKSVDTVCDATGAVNHPTEFLNSSDPPDMPPHNFVTSSFESTTAVEQQAISH